MRRTTRRTLATALVIPLLVAVGACSGNEASESDKDADAVTEIRTSEVTADSIVGLEVTALGNISGILSDHALRLDRNGVGEDGDRGEPGAEKDAAFDDDDVTEEGVLVVSKDSLADRSVDEEIRVGGTIRSFDQDTIESAHDLDLGEASWEEYENSLVIVADSVQPASVAPADG